MNLAALMAFAGDDQHVMLLQLTNTRF